MKMPFAYSVRWSVSFLAAMCLSYLLVGQLLARSAPAPLSAAELMEATELRLFSNELVSLVNVFLEKGRAAAGAAGMASYEQWIGRKFHPQTNDLRQRLVYSELSGSAHTALLAAADRAIGMGSQHEDTRLRESATAAVLEAVAKTESRIAQMGAEKHITPGPLTPSFSRR